MKRGRKRGGNWGCYCFLCEKNIVKHSVQCHVFAQSRQAAGPIADNHSTHRTAPDLCKNVSLAVLFGSNGNSCTKERIQHSEHGESFKSGTNIAISSTEYCF